MAKKHEVLLDTNIYNLDVIYTTAYVFLDRAYIFLKKGADGGIVVEIEAKTGDTDAIVSEFKNQLINYSQHHMMHEKNAGIRKMLLEQIFSVNSVVIDDPEGILIPWEEKYGKDKVQ